MTAQQFGIVISAYTFAAGISGLLAAFFLDRFDRKVALLWAGVGFAVGTFLCAFATNFWMLCGARAIAGAFGGVASSVVFATVGDAVAVERRGYAMGLLSMAFSMASVFGVPLGLLATNLFNWHAPFVALGSVALALMVLVKFSFPTMRSHLRSETKSATIEFAQILFDKTLFLRILFMFFLVMGQFLVIPFVSPSLVFNAGLPEAHLHYIYLVGGICSMFSAPLMGRLSDRFGYRLMGGVGIGFSLLPLLWVTQLGVIPTWLILSGVALFFFGMSGRMVPAMAMMTSAVDADRRGRFMSLSNCAQSFATAIAASLSGWIVWRAPSGHLESFDTVGYLAVGFSLLALILMLQMPSTAKNPIST